MISGTVLGAHLRAAAYFPDAPPTEPTPSAARTYDYYLGGKDNYAVDRDLAERVLRVAPVVADLVRANRAFLRQSARLLAERAGMRQFLDIGCGLPTRDNLDQIVRRVDPSCRVAYTDNDPMVLSHARALLAVDGNTDAFEADLRDPAGLLGHPGLRRLIDLDRPVAVLLLDVLHFVTDDEDPRAIMDRLLAGLPPGSHVALSHVVRTPEMDAVAALYREAGVPFTPRDREDIADLCRNLEPASLRYARLPDPSPHLFPPPSRSAESPSPPWPSLPFPRPDDRPGVGGRMPLACFIGQKSR